MCVCVRIKIKRSYQRSEPRFRFDVVADPPPASDIGLRNIHPSFVVACVRSGSGKKLEDFFLQRCFHGVLLIKIFSARNRREYPMEAWSVRSFMYTPEAKPQRDGGVCQRDFRLAGLASAEALLTVNRSYAFCPPPLTCANPLITLFVP